MIHLDRDGDVFVLRMDDGENRLTTDALAAWNDALATVETAEGPRALVTTGTDRFFSNGLDLDWMAANSTEALPYVDRVQRLFARVLALPCFTVAACNGHTFAAGAMLALAHDVSIMRSERGYWCLPEVDLGIPFTAGMDALISSRLSRRTAHEAMVTGRRYSAWDAVQAGIIDEEAGEADLLPRAISLAGEHAAKAGHAIGTIRTMLHHVAHEALTGAPHLGHP